MLLVVAAALSAVALRSRGLDAAGVPTGADGDLLVVVAPVLVAAAVAVLVARVVGPLLGLVVTLLTRLRGGVVFLGTARAARERSAAGVALVALALTVAAGLLGATAAATVRDGTAVAAAGATGADLRVSGFGFTDAEEAALARVPGLTDVAAWADPQNAGIAPGGANGGTTQTTVIATQPERLAAVQRDLPLVEPFPADAAQRLAGAVAAGGAVRSGDVRVPVAVSAGLAPVGATLDLTVAGRPVPATVVASVPTFAGAPADTFVVADLAQLRQRTGLALAPQYLLARVAGAVPDESRLRAAVPSLSATSSWEQTAQRATSSPVVRAVRAGLPTALAVGAGLAALTAVLSLLLGARERGRFLAHLRALGLSARQSAAPGRARGPAHRARGPRRRPRRGAGAHLARAAGGRPAPADGFGAAPGGRGFRGRRAGGGGSLRRGGRLRGGRGRGRRPERVAGRGSENSGGGMTAPAVLCEGLVRIFRTADVEVQALQGLDLRLEPGELVAMVGASGSGKSTLLGILSGLDTPTAGARRGRRRRPLRDARRPAGPLPA